MTLMTDEDKTFQPSASSKVTPMRPAANTAETWKYAL